MKPHVHPIPGQIGSPIPAFRRGGLVSRGPGAVTRPPLSRTTTPNKALVSPVRRPVMIGYNNYFSTQLLATAIDCLTLTTAVESLPEEQFFL